MPSARRVQWAKIRVAAVCVAALTILAVLFYLLTGGTLLEPKVTLYLYLPDGTGLAPGSPVRVDGIMIGKVDQVKLAGSRDPNRVVRVTMRVERNRLPSITSDSTAVISSESLIGDKFVDVTSHISPQPVRPGGEIQFKTTSTDMMKNLDLTQFEDQLRIVDANLRDIESGNSQLGQMIQGDAIYTDLLRRLTQLQAGVRAAVNTTGSVGKVLYSDTDYQQFHDILTRLDQSLQNVQSGPFLKDAGQYEKLLQTTTELHKSITSLRAGSLFRSDALYVDLNRTVASLVAAVDRMNASPSFSTSEVYDNLNGMAQSMQTSIKDFREHPQKYLRIKVF